MLFIVTYRSQIVELWSRGSETLLCLPILNKDEDPLVNEKRATGENQQELSHSVITVYIYLQDSIH